MKVDIALRRIRKSVVKYQSLCRALMSKNVITIGRILARKKNGNRVLMSMFSISTFTFEAPRRARLDGSAP